MANAIRVSDGSKWAYVPAGAEHQARLERFAAAGMAEISDGFVMLKHEAGEMFWEMLKKEFPAQDSSAILKIAEKAFDSKSIALLPDEEISFGEKDDSISYNKFADLSLTNGSSDLPVDLAAKPLEDGRIVMTIWPKSKRVIPAKVTHADKRVWLELPESQEKGERCFVLDDKDASFLTVSSESDGTDKVGAVNPNVITSWLCAAGSKSMRRMGGRYGVEHRPQGQFLITDRTSGKSYSGTISSHGLDIDNFELEKSRLERLLASKGLGAVLPLYILKRA